MLKQIFWDVNESELKSLSDEMIIKRAVTVGTLPVIQTVFSSYSRDKIVSSFSNLKPTSMPSRRYNYFKKLLTSSS